MYEAAGRYLCRPCYRESQQSPVWKRKYTKALRALSAASRPAAGASHKDHSARESRSSLKSQSSSTFLLCHPIIAHKLPENQAKEANEKSATGSADKGIQTESSLLTAQLVQPGSSSALPQPGTEVDKQAQVYFSCTKAIRSRILTPPFKGAICSCSSTASIDGGGPPNV